MAVKTKKEILETIKTRLGDDQSDEALMFIEDVSDTFDDYEQRVKGDGNDWKKKYEENDTEWRKKYKERFFSEADEQTTQQTTKDANDGMDNDDKLTYEKLFKEE